MANKVLKGKLCGMVIDAEHVDVPEHRAHLIAGAAGAIQQEFLTNREEAMAMARDGRMIFVIAGTAEDIITYLSSKQEEATL
jgi:hypothetical protein